MPLPRTDTQMLQDALFSTMMGQSNGVELTRHVIAPFDGYLERAWLTASAPTGGAGVSVDIVLNEGAALATLAFGGAQPAYTPVELGWNAMDSPVRFTTGDVLLLVPSYPGVGTATVIAQLMLGRT